MKTRHTDTLIIGAGLSGLYTALLIDSTKTVTILVKDALAESNSNLAQGGIAAELEAEKALIEAHRNDTLSAGSFLNDVDAVKLLVEEAYENIEQLMRFNVTFDKDKEGKFHLTKEGGHTHSRVLHSGGDATGKDMMDALKKHVRTQKNIEILEMTMAIDLVFNNDDVVGVSALTNNGDSFMIAASDIIFATGGIGAIYHATTNAAVATGDGIAMALRAGITVEKMEFVQFHPTAFLPSMHRQRRKFLISEALRGEGATLVNSEGERFMSKYHNKGDLAPRDIVSQAIYREMYDTWTDHVYIDTRHLDKTALQSRFPTIHAHLSFHGYALGEDLIPVSPVEHFAIGGIKTDLNGQTSINHIYSVGENASTGVHGANRLASNSLLECVVFGNRIARHINTKKRRDVKFKPLSVNYDTYNYHYAPLRRKLGLLMEEHAGIVRTESGLLKAKKEVKSMLINLKRYPNHAIRYYETLNMTMVAMAIIEQALARQESIGCHYRLD